MSGWRLAAPALGAIGFACIATAAACGGGAGQPTPSPLAMPATGSGSPSPTIAVLTPTAISRPTVAPTPTVLAPPLVACPPEVRPDVCDFAASAAVRVRAGGVAALLPPGVTPLEFVPPGGVPRLVAIGCPNGSVRSMLQSH